MAKTLKIKKAEPTVAAQPVPPADGAPAPAAEPAPSSGGGIYVSARHKMENAGIGPGAAVERPERFAWAAVLAVISTILVILVLIMEFADFEALKLA